jgi:hypothetical protein
MDPFARYLGAPHAVAVNSSTAGLHLALEAVGLITKYLPIAVKDGGNMEARTRLAWGRAMSTRRKFVVVVPPVVTTTAFVVSGAKSVREATSV